MAIPWPGTNRQILYSGAANCGEPSGATYHPRIDKWFWVDDGGTTDSASYASQGRVYMVDGDGSNQKFICIIDSTTHRDIEGICYADPASDFIYVLNETNQLIYELSITAILANAKAIGNNPNTAVVPAARTWNVGAVITLISGGNGPEGLTFIPIGGHAEGGVFVIGTQLNGGSYYFELKVVTSAVDTTVTHLTGAPYYSPGNSPYGWNDLGDVAYDRTRKRMFLNYDGNNTYVIVRPFPNASHVLEVIETFPEPFATSWEGFGIDEVSNRVMLCRDDPGEIDFYDVDWQSLVQITGTGATLNTGQSDAATGTTGHTGTIATQNNYQIDKGDGYVVDIEIFGTGATANAVQEDGAAGLPLVCVEFRPGHYLGSWAIDDYVPVTATVRRPATGEAYNPSTIHFSVYESETDGSLTKLVADQPLLKRDNTDGFYSGIVQLTAAAGFNAGGRYIVLMELEHAGAFANTECTIQVESVTAAPTVGEIADGVLDEVITSGHDVLGSLAQRIGATYSKVQAGVTTTDISQTALAKFFTQNTGTDYLNSVVGSVVREIADHAGSAGIPLNDIADAVWNRTIRQITSIDDGAIVSDTFDIGALLPQHFDPTCGFTPVTTSVAAAGNATTITLNPIASAENDYYNGMSVVLTTGTGAGQARSIIDYDGSLRIAAISPNWTTNPVNGTGYAILPTAAFDAGSLATAVWAAGTRSLTDKAGFSIGAGGITSGSYAGGAITAASLATDAIGALELGADAAAEIATAVWASGARTLSAPTNLTSTGGSIPITAGGLVSSDVTAISTDTVAADNLEKATDGGVYNVGGGGIVAASVAGNVAGIGSGGITAGSFASGAINAAAIATDAIGSDELAASAVTELGIGVWATVGRTLSTAINITSTGAPLPITAGGLVSADMTAISTSATAANNAETALTGGSYNVGGGGIIAASVAGNIAGNVTGTIGGLTQAALAQYFLTDSGTNYGAAHANSVVKQTADFAGGASLTEAGIADAVWQELIADHSSEVGSVAEALAAAGGAFVTPSAIASAVWDALKADYNDADTFGAVLNAGMGSVNAAAVADAVLEELVADHSGVAGSLAAAVAAIPSADAIADQVYEEAAADHDTPGTFGELLNTGAAGLTEGQITDACATALENIKLDHLIATDLPGDFNDEVSINSVIGYLADMGL